MIGRLSFELEMEHYTDCVVELSHLEVTNIKDEHGHTPHSVNPYMEITFSNDHDHTVVRTPALRNNPRPVWNEVRAMRFRVCW